MAAKILPDVELLRQIFHYDPETGLLTNKSRPKNMFPSELTWKAWTTRFAGTPVTKNAKNRIDVSISGVSYLGHRIAYKMFHGIEPPPVLDHINMIKTDNRISNLRPASYSQNACNKRKQSNNKVGAKGVSFDKYTRRYAANIAINKQQIHLGRFDTVEEAVAAYERAAAIYHGDFARTN